MNGQILLESATTATKACQNADKESSTFLSDYAKYNEQVAQFRTERQRANKHVKEVTSLLASDK